MKSPTLPTWKTVLFLDLDSTLLRGPFSSVVFPTILQELSEKSGLAAPEIRRMIVQENLERQQNIHIPAVQAMDWDDISVHIASQLGVKLETFPTQLVQTHAGPPHAYLLDHAQQALLDLNAPWRALVVATKGLRKYQLPIVEALGIAGLFAEIITPDSHQALKKDVAFFGNWPQRTRLQIFIGDLYEDDVAPPKSFGFKVIWKPQNQPSELAALNPFARAEQYPYSAGQVVHPDAIIFSLTEAPPTVLELEARYL